MASFNKVIIMGNLTRDPEIRAAGAAGSKVARIRLAINERRRDSYGQLQDFPVFIDVDAWDKLAELCGQHLSKGSCILVDGRLQMDAWERDGVKHQKLKVRASTIKFIPRGEPRYGSGAREGGQEYGPNDVPQIPESAPGAYEGDGGDAPF